ncbi:hypothetical protein [Flavicella sp.]|uniref:hypothetical protein n=1 Tax=Flavicella sp. TaxID=2957742 RepID=UPI00260F156B|nr:hypothetical protein [Flavicella sp.]MDG1803719.1 hypothetical protein [Flavicella sp.]MDG2281440.1 hypothetical protein [Flavicella sp.]
MKNLVMSTKTVLLAILTIGMLVSCNDDTSETAPVEPQDPIEVQLGFEGYTLTPEGEGQRKVGKMEDSNIPHVYQTQGYTVEITGGVSNGKVIFSGIDLAAPEGLSFTAVGDVSVKVFHPDFIEVAVTEEAYYGTENQSITYGTAEALITTDLVQGFVIVTEGEGAENVITGLDVNTVTGKSKDVPYYSADANFVVNVYTTGQDLTGTATNDIGAGVRFTVDSNGQLIKFVLPEFGDPEDGNLNPITPVN